ncbi:hydrogenase expression/formation protein [Rhodobacter capsulatus]|uniref:hydrogenase expression/formation protein n=1 Tax=Rhodobacter capsulatus TaxID=1061 RepID=UPI0006DC04D1|nr:hydrogenase expression/formation protein [Rhodobacter capsulatus]KQB13965.1 hydrogenase accessory protein HypB [Rhodobacter capsulatus]KQB14284.1 hydrogenase accessory protein HypB [Rhodobacter capsulatus]PZX25720.1 hydrogenase-1 operon protein HyaF [Rhodobacter capsulatus]QNR64024.1 hydrogenase expression/formation protein [Rhodobacter capsulatus]
MVSNFHLPPVGFGPGSQSDEDEELGYMQLPSGMRTYAAHLPEVEDTSSVAPALKLLSDIAAAAEACVQGGMASFELAGLDAQNRALIAETMGQGEVAMKIRGIPALMVQESVFAGVWSVAAAGVDRIEVGAVPAAALSRAFEPFRKGQTALPPLADGVVNAPALIAELFDKSAAYVGGAADVINLTLLPHTEEDLTLLDTMLGEGAVTILSRGYGNCRITATATPHVWRVQFYNSTDALILDTIEVTTMPEVALAAREDLEDSADRIREVLEAIR